MITGAIGTTLKAQYVPPDLYGESYKESYAVVPNAGQVVNIDGTLATDVVAYSAGSLPQLFMQGGSEMSIVWHSVDTIDTTLDTLWSLGVRPYGSTANNNVTPTITSIKNSFENFHLPQCPNGVTSVYGYNRVVYENIFPLIDQHIYSGPRGWKIAFVIRPGGDPSKLVLQFEGQDSLGIDPWGFLRVVLADKWINLPEAVAYQVDANNVIFPLNWTANYSASNNNGTVGLIVDTYDPARALVLQIGIPPLGGGPIETPGICWSTYWGGQAENKINVITADKDANLYAAGRTTSPFLTFPGNEYGIQYVFSSPAMCLSKINPDHSVAWTSYYGANTNSQWVRDIEPDGLGGIYMVGGCGFSFLLPLVGYQYPWFNGANGFVSRFNTTTGVLEWSTGFNNCLDAAIDQADKKLVVAGITTNGLLYQPPAQPLGATFYPYSGGDIEDGFVAKFKLNGELEWSTFLGGTGVDQAWAVAAGHGNIAVALRTRSADIPLLTPTGGFAYAQQYGGGAYDAYLYRFSAAGVHEWGTYYGGSEIEWVHGAGSLDLDPTNGDIAVTGITTSLDLPIVPGPGWYIGTMTNFNTQGSFVARFKGQNDALLWSSYIRADDEPSYSGIRTTQVEFGANSSLFIAGMADDDDFIWQQAPGLYYSNTLINQRDGFILWLDHQHTVRWSTLFGGEEQNFQDWIGSISFEHTSSTLYAAGTTRANYAVGEFFPLTDPGFPAYFREIAIEPEDSYLSAFCIDYFTSTEEAIADENLRLRMIDDSHLSVSGLAPGKYDLVVVDATGRQVVGIPLSMYPNSSTAEVRLPVLANGIYLVTVGGTAARVQIVR